MKISSLLSIAILTLLTSAAFAETTVCAGPSLYYSVVRADIGMQPLPGTKIGSRTIVSNGAVLLKLDLISGLGVHSVAPYIVELSEDTELVETTGSKLKGSSITKTVATLYKVNTKSPSKKKRVSQEEVVCQHTWRMAI